MIFHYVICIFSKSCFIIFQVEIDTDNTLKAMREGIVMLTCERINPKKDNYVAEKYYANLASPIVHKRYFNVVPFKQGQKFKLVDLVQLVQFFLYWHLLHWNFTFIIVLYLQCDRKLECNT